MQVRDSPTQYENTVIIGKEMDQYKVATTTNSCSTMHKIAAKEFTQEDFSCEHLIDAPEYEESSCCEDDFPEFEERDGEMVFWTPIDILRHTIDELNFYRQRYLETKDKKYWWQMIQLLPSSYNQLRTWDASLETILSILKQRKGHKLDEWGTFREACLANIPYCQEFYNALTGDKN